MKAKYLGVLRYISYACSLAAWCSATESTKGFPVLSQPMLHISPTRFTIHNVQQQEERKKNIQCDAWYEKMGVSKNRGTPKWMVYKGKPYQNGWIWGYHYFWKHPNGMFESICEKIHLFQVKIEELPPGVWRSHNSPGWFIQILIMVCYNPLYTLIQPEVLFFFHGSYVIFVCLGFFLKPAVAFKIVLKVTVSQSAKPKGLPVL